MGACTGWALPPAGLSALPSGIFLPLPIVGLGDPWRRDAMVWLAVATTLGTCALLYLAFYEYVGIQRAGTGVLDLGHQRAYVHMYRLHVPSQRAATPTSPALPR